ncbi:MAG: transposase [Burkholderiaceae bacterium]
MPLHGEQQRREFHAYYDHHCYLPLYVFCGQAMLVCYLRNSKIDGQARGRGDPVAGQSHPAQLARSRSWCGVTQGSVVRD